MIAVVADDFTGAAELAGIGLRYGLSVHLSNQVGAIANADLLVVNTNSRSLSKKEALEMTEQAMMSLTKNQPVLIYKKIDSVLRGYVLDELKVQMRCLASERALILPANPSLGRTIAAGKYYVQGQPIHETGFANDPEFAMKHPEIQIMLRADAADQISILKNTDPLPSAGILVGEASTVADVDAWAGRIDATTALIGAGDFFEAILKRTFQIQPLSVKPNLYQPYLYISGTAFSSAQKWVKQVHVQTQLVHYLSDPLLQGVADAPWFDHISQSLQKHQKAIIAIEADTVLESNMSALQLRTRMAKIVKKLIDQEGIKEILIEGGSTAASIFEALDIKEFDPTNEFSRGVIRMKALGRDLYISVKPGSYDLPAQISEYFLPKHN